MIATNQGLGTLEQATDRDFFVWVDPTNFSIKHHVALVGSFYGGPAIPSLVDGPEGLPFIANPNEVPQSLSPFHSNVVRDYRVEWNLESLRYREFGHLPSRLQALFLLDTKSPSRKLLSRMNRL
jgi:hypothetical protein